MLEIFDYYQPRANTPTADYPNGSVRNQTTPGTATGTPLDEAFANDQVGFSEALLAYAERVVSGVPDTAITSDRLEALKVAAVRAYATSQLGGSVGVLADGVTIDALDYVVWPDDLTVWRTNGATGTSDGTFTPGTGVAGGVTGTLSQVVIDIDAKYRQSVTVDFASGAGLTLTADQNLYGNVTLTDTGVVLAAARNVIVSDAERDIVVTNSTAQDLTVKTVAGTGVVVYAGRSELLRVDGTDVVYAADGVRTQLNASGAAPMYACRAWVNFDGTGAVAIRASGNISSITDNGTGRYTVNFLTAMEDVNYSASINGGYIASDDIVSTVSSISFIVRNSSSSVIDIPVCYVNIFR